MLAFSKSALISFWSSALMSNDIVPVELLLRVPFTALAFAAWKMAKIAFPPSIIQGNPSSSAHLIMASLKAGYVFAVPSSKRKLILSLFDFPRVPIRKRGPVGLRYQPKLGSPWDGETPDRPRAEVE